MKILWWNIVIKKAPSHKDKRITSKKASSFKKSLFSFITTILKLLLLIALFVVVYFTLMSWFLKLEIFVNWEGKDVSSAIFSILTLATANSLLK